MSDSALMTKIEEHVLDAIEKKFGSPPQGMPEVVRGAIVQAVIDYRKTSADRAIYETSLGSFIIEQNPYSSWENLVFPNLPLDPNGENPWVRKSGVLVDHHAGNPLPKDKPIPGGMVVDFSYSDWQHLYDPEEPRDGESAARTATVFPPDKTPEAPESDPPRKQSLPPQYTYFFGHNIIKSVRLKYKFLDRRYPPADAVNADMDLVEAKVTAAGAILAEKALTGDRGSDSEEAVGNALEVAHGAVHDMRGAAAQFVQAAEEGASDEQLAAVRDAAKEKLEAAKSAADAVLKAAAEVATAKGLTAEEADGASEALTGIGELAGGDVQAAIDQLKAAGARVKEMPGRDVHAGFILILYSGSDHG